MWCAFRTVLARTHTHAKNETAVIQSQVPRPRKQVEPGEDGRGVAQGDLRRRRREHKALRDGSIRQCAHWHCAALQHAPVYRAFTSSSGRVPGPTVLGRSQWRNAEGASAVDWSKIAVTRQPDRALGSRKHLVLKYTARDDL